MATVNLSSYEEESVPTAENLRFGIVVSEWNHEITEGLYKGAADALIHHGAAPHNIIRVNVPGSFELVYGAKVLAKETELDAIVVLGSVIQGETRHFEFVCDAVAQGIKDLNVLLDIPVIFGVLTDNTLEQAQARSGGKLGNKGTECAIAAIKMAAITHVLRDEEESDEA